MLLRRNVFLNAEQPENAATVPGAKVGRLSLTVGVIGFAVSLYALAAHLKSTITGAPLACDINETVSCSRVFESTYGDLGGIPLGAFGLAYFGIVIAAAILPMQTDVSERWMSRWRAVIASVGALVSASLFYISSFRLRAVCPVCTTIHVLNLINFIGAFLAYQKNKNGHLFAHPNAFLKLVSVSLLFATPPMVIGALAPSFAPLLFKKDTVASAAPAAESAAPKPEIAKELLTWSKSNFVGKGEDYRKGSDDARVVMMMWSDLECPACRMAASAIDSALSQVGPDKVLFIYRNYPLNGDCNPTVHRRMHAHACELAIGGRCAGRQQKFWEFKEWAFQSQDKDEPEKDRIWSKDGLTAEAKELGMDAVKFRQCMDSNVELGKIREDVEAGDKVGIPGTPTIIINGHRLESGFNQPEVFVREFQKYLSK